MLPLTRGCFFLFMLARMLCDGFATYVEISYVLEPFDFENATAEMIERNPSAPYDPTYVTFSHEPVNTKAKIASVELVADSLFGDASLRLVHGFSGATVNPSNLGTFRWINNEVPFNCHGATHLSLWYKVPAENPAIEMSIVAYDDSSCSTSCSDPRFLKVFSTQPFLLSRTSLDSEWQEVLVSLLNERSDFVSIDGIGSRLALDRIRGWGLSFSGTTPIDIQVDHLSCIGGGELLGAMLRGKDSFEEEVATGAWEEVYFRSDLSANLTNVTLDDGEMEVSYAVEQTETWGGFVQFSHFFPGNAYFNLTKATELHLSYRVTRPASDINRAHLRLILADGRDCSFDCRELKNTETYYSFFYILDEPGPGSISILLEGSDNPSSPLWRTGWTGSAHNGVLEISQIKGISFEVSIDLRGDIGSFVYGSFAFSNMEVREESSTDGLSDSEEANVDFVLDPFDIENVTSAKLQNFNVSDIPYSTSSDITFSTFEPADGLRFFTTSTAADAYSGSGSFQIEISKDNATTALGPQHGELHWLANEADYNFVGAKNLSLWYKIPTGQADIALSVALFDDSNCSEDCSDTRNLETFITEPIILGLLQTAEGQNFSLWQELVVSVESAFSSVAGNGELPPLGHIRGWGLIFDVDLGDEPSVLLVDHLSIQGPLFGSIFGSDSLASSLSKNVWEIDYLGSNLSENLTEVELGNGQLSVDYVIEQTEIFGGQITLSHVPPGNSYYDLSDAAELLLDYQIKNISSAPGRAHLRVILWDAAECYQDCLDTANSEAYYSFSYILDESSSGTVRILLQGSEFPSSSALWRTGWTGAAHNGIFDSSRVKGIAFQLAIDARGAANSTVSGALSFGNLKVVKDSPDLVGLIESDVMAVVEPGLHFQDLGYRLISFLDTEACIDRCLRDQHCDFGQVDLDFRDCYLGTASSLTGDSIFVSPSSVDFANDVAFWIDDKTKRGDLCNLCDCVENERRIDCTDRDLVLVPKTFAPTSWAPRVVDLRGNPRLTFIGTGAFSEVSGSLEEIYFPGNLRYLAPGSVNALPALRSVFLPEGISWGTHSIENVIGTPTSFFGDICCDKAFHMELLSPPHGLSFCEVKTMEPGIDSTYHNFSQIIQGEVVVTLTQGSDFSAEASESPEKCAEYCSLYPDCRYFTHDARYNEAQHRCYLLANNGTHSENICCFPGDFADLEMTIPGITSGASPRARHEVFNASVAVSPTSLQAEAGNSYTVQFDVRLGAQPVRGAVWIFPTVVSSTALNYELSPTSVALYDSETTATFTVSVSNSEIVEGRGETLVISNRVQSCDSAFVALDNEASNVFIQVLVPQKRFSRTMMTAVSILGTLLLLSSLATLFIWERRRQLLTQLKTDEDSSERDEEMEVRKIIRSDDILLCVSRTVVLSAIASSCIAMTVWANNLFEASLEQERTFETTHETTSHLTGDRAYMIVLTSTFALLLVMFSVYDWLVRRRNRKLIFNAAKASELVTNMFPEQVREQMLNETRTNKNRRRENKRRSEENELSEDNVLAELYPNTTLCFSDISGFTAWSSSRQPQQVFVLLEQVFGIFDVIARDNKIYKVESVGDCYLAIAGAPKEKEDHAEAVCLYAVSCLKRFKKLSQRLVVSLGPDTSELNLRIGIHSGQVVFGVLRNERARYQLFGDCVNVASRMESTGEPGKIQISLETAEILKMRGKEHWFMERDGPVATKGKGYLETFWLDLSKVRVNYAVSEASSDSDHMSDIGKYGDISSCLSQMRLIEWSVKSLTALIKKIIVHRQGSTAQKEQNRSLDSFRLEEGKTFFDEVAEIIELPPPIGLDIEKVNLDDIHVDYVVIRELRELVGRIAAMYNDNPFHNFEHANHVTLSIIKLLSRIVKPSDQEDDQSNTSYGITSDPLTQFACCFSSLIHDLNHPGVFNTQLSKENPVLGERYKHRSVAEQNSLELGLELFTADAFSNLRAVLFSTSEDQERFRQLVVNSVMATDIVDKDLKALRNTRWKKAFDDADREEESADVSQNRKATIVIEHLIQASDVAHTMQHWNIYTKWNQRLFSEMYVAFKTGRSPVDPAAIWAKGEIGFFDFYIIPLAKKLKECGVFGVSSDEYLNYALQNRRRWELEGQAVTAQMIETIEREYEADELALRVDQEEPLPSS